MPSVTTSPVLLTSEGALIQNLGPDDLFVTDEETATAADGVQVSMGNAVAVGDGQLYHGVSAGTSDVRVLRNCVGIFGVAVTP